MQYNLKEYLKRDEKKKKKQEISLAIKYNYNAILRKNN